MAGADQRQGSAAVGGTCVFVQKKEKVGDQGGTCSVQGMEHGTGGQMGSLLARYRKIGTMSPV